MLHRRVDPGSLTRLKRFGFSWICAVLNLGLFLGFAVWRDSSLLFLGLEVLGYYAATFPLLYLALALIVQMIRGQKPAANDPSELPSLSEVPGDR